ncbi:unnamed protein product [Lathyrus sativus]|nr:unnamed protein product [Lathyrus sativus]
MGYGRGRGRGRPRLVPPSAGNPTMTDQHTAEEENYVGDETRTELLECGSQAGKEKGATDTETLNHLITEEAKSDEVASQTKKLRVNIINENRNPAKGLTMEFVALKIVDGEMEIQIEEEDVEKEVKFWKSALIMYVLSVDLSMNAVKQFMSKT